MEVFDQRGLLPRLGKVEISDEGHFGGVPLDFSALEGAHFGGKGVPQARAEAMLGEWATELVWISGLVTILVQLTSDGDVVDIEVRTPDGRHRLGWRRLTGQDISDGIPIWGTPYGNASRQAAGS